jgi:hypothetical protein
LFFFCKVEAKSGGETPIVLSHYVYNKVKFLEFVEKLEKCGLIYTRFLGEGDDSSSPIGCGWQSVFATSDKVVAEERYAFFISFNIAFFFMKQQGFYPYWNLLK